MPIFFFEDKDDETRKKIVEEVQRTLRYPWDGIREESFRQGMTNFLVMMATEFEDPLYIEILKATKDQTSYKDLLSGLGVAPEEVNPKLEKLVEYKFLSKKHEKNNEMYQARESTQLLYDPDFLKILQQVTDLFVRYGKNHDIVF